MARRFNRFKGYQMDSKWEVKLAEGVLSELKYHPRKLAYTKPATQHTYEPDWEVRQGNKIIFIEAKGRFRDPAEYKKYLYIKDSLKPNQELVFLFMKELLPMPGAKRRKDGTIRTHKEWAEKNGFRTYNEETITKLIGDK